VNSQKKPKFFDLFGLFASRAKIVTQIYVCLLSAGCDVICGPCMPTFFNIKLLWNMYSCILAVYLFCYTLNSDFLTLRLKPKTDMAFACWQHIHPCQHIRWNCSGKAPNTHLNLVMAQGLGW